MELIPTFITVKIYCYLSITTVKDTQFYNQIYLGQIMKILKKLLNLFLVTNQGSKVILNQTNIIKLDLILKIELCYKKCIDINIYIYI